MFNTSYTDMYFGKSPLLNNSSITNYPLSNDYFSNELSSIREWNRRNLYCWL